MACYGVDLPTCNLFTGTGHGLSSTCILKQVRVDRSGIEVDVSDVRTS